jgi:hypothetical protein
MPSGRLALVRDEPAATGRRATAGAAPALRLTWFARSRLRRWRFGLALVGSGPPAERQHLPPVRSARRLHAELGGRSS